MKFNYIISYIHLSAFDYFQNFTKVLLIFNMQSVSINVASLPQDYPSICIPRVFSNIKWQLVKSTIEQLGLGRVDRVDMVQKSNEKGEKFQRVFIHMKFWDRAEQAQMVRQKLLSGDNIKVVYNDPWYWQLSMSRIAKPTFQKKKFEHTHHQKSKPRIVVDVSVPTPTQHRPTWTTPTHSHTISSPPPPIRIPTTPSIPMTPTLHPSGPHSPPMGPGPQSPPMSFQHAPPAPSPQLQTNATDDTPVSTPVSTPVKRTIRRIKKQ